MANRAGIIDAASTAKPVFQVHCVDEVGQVIIRRQVKRRHVKRRHVLAFFQKRPPCPVGVEACASSHHLAEFGIVAPLGRRKVEDQHRRRVFNERLADVQRRWKKIWRRE
jgi:hypothetical protein